MRRITTRGILTRAVFGVMLAASVAAAQGQVSKRDVPGVRNFAALETTIACAGAVTPEGVAEIRKLGYASIINLRQATEEGANADAEEAAARQAGIRYVHLPFDGAAPDPAVADRFLAVIAEPANQPALVHCSSGNRAAALWMIKRLVADGWSPERATAEAKQLGLTSEKLQAFALDYAAKHRR